LVLLSSTVEVRCPLGPQRLFTKLKLGEEFGRYIHPANLIEFTCSDCARRLSREQHRPLRVFHRFNFLGELIETVTESRWQHTTLTDPDPQG
jgi:hypothetical protein